MQGKTALKISLAIFAVLGLCLGIYQYQKYRAVRSLTINAMLECKENLNFLYECESFMRESVSETDAMIQAQAGIQRTLKDRDINALLNSGISGNKKDAALRLLDNMHSYNAMLSYAFYGSTAGRAGPPESAPGTGEMIREFSDLVKILEGK